MSTLRWVPMCFSLHHFALAKLATSRMRDKALIKQAICSVSVCLQAKIGYIRYGLSLYNKLLHKMGISETPNCLFCGLTETIEHVYLKCPNVVALWQEIEGWVKSLHFPHFKISEIEKIFGEKYNNHIKHIIIISTKDTIYQTRKKGEKMNLADAKRCIKRNLHIERTRESIKDGTSNFDEYWKPFIDTLRLDPATLNSWYRI